MYDDIYIYIHIYIYYLYRYIHPLVSIPIGDGDNGIHSSKYGKTNHSWHDPVILWRTCRVYLLGVSACAETRSDTYEICGRNSTFPTRDAPLLIWKTMKFQAWCLKDGFPKPEQIDNLMAIFRGWTRLFHHGAQIPFITMIWMVRTWEATTHFLRLRVSGETHPHIRTLWRLTINEQRIADALIVTA